MATMTANNPGKQAPIKRKRPVRIGSKGKYILGRIILYLLVLMFVFAVVAPFIWMVISSISPQTELAQKPPHWFPENPTLHRYKALIFGPETGQILPAAAEKFLRALASSMVVSVSTTIICTVAGTMAAYALARLSIPGEDYIMTGTLGAQMVPIITIIIPLYLFMQRIDMMDTWRGLVLLYCGFMLPTVIWIMHSYFLTIPKELEEAAMIDGCTPAESLIKVVLPLCGPGLVAVSAFTFLSSWNEFFMALIFSGSHAKTITVIVTEFSSQFGIDFGLMATGGVVGSIPPMILAFMLQRYIVAGLTSGALKG